jgi:hypothetical protein
MAAGSRAERLLLMIRTIATQRVRFVCTANDLSAHTTIFGLFEATLSCVSGPLVFEVFSA